jgi:hypothetical protein
MIGKIQLALGIIVLLAGLPLIDAMFKNYRLDAEGNFRGLSRLSEEAMKVRSMESQDWKDWTEAWSQLSNESKIVALNAAFVTNSYFSTNLLVMAATIIVVGLISVMLALQGLANMLSEPKASK